MPRVSAKKFQRRISELDAQYTVPHAHSKHVNRRALALIILALIAVAALASVHRTTSDFYRIALKQGTTRQMSEANGAHPGISTWPHRRD